MLDHFYNPFPAVMSPLTSKVHEQITQWSVKNQLLLSEQEKHKFDILRSSYLTGRSYPYADIERLLLATKWVSWFFIFDDRRDETETGENLQQVKDYLTQLLSIITNESNKHLIDQNDTLQLNLNQLWKETNDMAFTAWRERFIQTIKESFDGFIWEVENRERKTTPSVEEYKEKRIFSSSFYVGIDLVEFAENIQLPHDVISHPIIQKLRYYACSTACWNNDLFSYPKEQHHEDVHNLVLLIQREEKIPLEEAANRVMEIHNQDVRSFIEYEKQIPSFDSEMDQEVARYVKGLKVGMRGHLDWMIEGTSRFK